MTFSEEQEFTQGVEGLVKIYRLIWGEVDKQFHQLPKGDRFRVFGIVAPAIGEALLYMPALEEEIEKGKKGKRAPK
jgi:hypothetical protein